jgi:hypothetical protein
LVTSALVRAPELQNANIKVQFSRQRLEVNSASSKWTSEKRFEILRQFASMLTNVFSKSVFKLEISGSKVGQKTQNLTGKLFFAKRVWVL